MLAKSQNPKDIEKLKFAYIRFGFAYSFSVGFKSPDPHFTSQIFFIECPVLKSLFCHCLSAYPLAVTIILFHWNVLVLFLVPMVI